MQKNQKGAVLLIEAAIVFPIVFMIIFLIISLGNLYYIRAYMDNVAIENALLAADYAANEMILLTEREGYELTRHDVNPYQYSVSGDLKNHINNKIKNEVNDDSHTILAAMSPYSISDSNGGSEFAEFTWGLFASTVNVEIKYKVNVIPLLKNFGITTVEYKSSATANINDNVELIRNLDLLKDLFTDFTQTESGSRWVNNIAGKIKNVLSKVGDVLNFLGR